ncbi:MAG TPA: DEAD/DEAH box helicase [Streptosporangiaceae bacterium]|nr:DEAD/DEAH box helicase [Streptosporangiaceae bacterium]
MPDTLADHQVPAEGTATDHQVPAEGAEKTFRDLEVAEPICTALEAAGITAAFPIQALAVPIALSGQDLIGQARTGTGKTLAFGVPLLQQLAEGPDGQRSAPRALVVVPTRELAIQVADDLRIAGARLGTRVVTVYGGRAYEPQIEALADVDLVVGTPGRLLDLARQGHLDLSQVAGLVLDEADKMLDLGFLPDVEKILRLTPPRRQTMLFSATMPGEVVTLARQHLRRPTHIRAEHHDEPTHVPSTEQHVFRAHQMDKIEVLARVLQADGRGLTIVFCRTKRACDQVATALTTRGFAAAAVHGDLGQGQRERAMRAFRNGKVDVLVATDVAARGLDVDDVTHVVNYECPEDDKAYLHRTGRTGRAGRTGVAVTFVDWGDLQRWKLINETLGLGQPEPEETYSTSQHLYSALRIPQDATGMLPAAKRGRLGLEAEDLEDIGETGRNRSHAARETAGRGGRPRAGRGDTARSHETGQRRQRARRRTRAGVTIAENRAEPAAPDTRGAEADDAAQAPRPAAGRRRRSRRRGSRGGGAAGPASGTGQSPSEG